MCALIQHGQIDADCDEIIMTSSASSYLNIFNRLKENHLLCSTTESSFPEASLFNQTSSPVIIILRSFQVVQKKIALQM